MDSNEIIAAEHIAAEIMQHGETLARSGDQREFSRTSHYEKDSWITFRVNITPEILAQANELAVA